MRSIANLITPNYLRSRFTNKIEQNVLTIQWSFGGRWFVGMQLEYAGMVGTAIVVWMMVVIVVDSCKHGLPAISNGSLPVTSISKWLADSFIWRVIGYMPMDCACSISSSWLHRCSVYVNPSIGKLKMKWTILQPALFWGVMALEMDSAPQLSSLVECICPDLALILYSLWGLVLATSFHPQWMRFSSHHQVQAMFSSYQISC